MAIERIKATAINKGEPYQDGDLVTGEMVNQVVKVLKDGVNYNKFFIDAMFAGDTEEALVLGTPKNHTMTEEADITFITNYLLGLDDFTVDLDSPDIKKVFLFRCLYEDDADEDLITGVASIKYYKGTKIAEQINLDQYIYYYTWAIAHDVSMDTFIKGISNDFSDYNELTTLDDDDLFIVNDNSELLLPKRITKSNLKETIGVNDVNQRVDDVLDGTTSVKKAEQDASGNVITTTYETKIDATNKLAFKADKTYVDTEISNIENGTTIVEKAKRDKNGNDIVETYETKADATSKLALKANITYVDSKDAILQSQIYGNVSDIESLELHKEDKSMKGQPNGYAPLDDSGYIPSAFVPNSFDDVIEFNTYAALLAYGMPMTNKLFIVKQDETSGGNHSTYRWTGTMYIRVTDEMSAAEVKVLYESNADTNPLTDVLKNNYNEAYAHSQIIGSNPHQTTYAQLLDKPVTIEQAGILNVYNKEYIDLLKDKNGWKSELLGTLSNNGTIALSVINQYDEIQMYAKDTLGVIDNENIRPSLMQSGDSVYFFDDTQAFIMVDTVFGFYAPVGYTLQVVGLKYTDFTAEEVAFDDTALTLGATNVQEAIEKVVTERTPSQIDLKIKDIGLDTPIEELNNHTLREVFEDGNVVVNGDFSDGTTGWTPSGSTLSNVSNDLLIKGNGTFTAVRATQTLNLIESSDYVYFRIKFKNDFSANNTEVKISGYNYNIIINSPVVNEHYTFNVKKRLGALVNKTLELRSNYIDSATANNKVTTFDYIYMYNLTNLGLSDLTVQQLDGWFNMYQTIKDKSTTVYIFDEINKRALIKEEESKNINYDTFQIDDTIWEQGGATEVTEYSTSTRIRTKILDLKETVQIDFKGQGVYRFGALLYDENNNYLYDFGWQTIDNFYIIPYGTAKKVRFVMAKTDDSVLSPSSVNGVFTVNNKENKNSYVNFLEGVRGVAHRGLATFTPENTIPSLRLASEAGFRYVECDVRLTSDNVWVVIHDATIDRTSNGTGNVSDMTLAQLKTYDFGSWKSPIYTGTQIPTLEELIIEAKKQNVILHIELKVSPNINRTNELIDILYTHGVQNIYPISSFEISDLKRFVVADENINVGLITSTFTTTNIDYIEEHLKTPKNKVTVNLYETPTIDKSMMLYARKKGLDVEISVLNTKASIMYAVNQGVNGITSDFVNIQEILKKY